MFLQNRTVYLDENCSLKWKNSLVINFFWRCHSWYSVILISLPCHIWYFDIPYQCEPEVFFSYLNYCMVSKTQILCRFSVLDVKLMNEKYKKIKVIYTKNITVLNLPTWLWINNGNGLTVNSYLLFSMSYYHFIKDQWFPKWSPRGRRGWILEWNKNGVSQVVSGRLRKFIWFW